MKTKEGRTVWIEVRAEFDQLPLDWSIYADAFDRNGCPGSIVSDEPASISGYLVAVPGSDNRVDRLQRELLRLGANQVALRDVPEEDWSASWRQFFKPRRIGKRLVVRPTWETYEAETGDVELVLDPGQAFGTGDHPTTRLCLALLEEVAIEGLSVLDLGCGSGILSIAAAKLGAGRVVGTDIEAIAVEVARQNASMNRVQPEFFVSDGFEPEGPGRAAAVNPTIGPFDLVVSNIISATLIRLAPEVSARVKPGGRWIVSGVIPQNWPDVRAAAEKCGFFLKEERFEDEWVAAVFEFKG